MEEKVIAIHQPNFLPWIGFFYKIFKADLFIILDDVQYTKNGYINRNRIKTQHGEQWLSIPVKHTGKFGQTIKDVEILNPEMTFRKIINSLTTNYAKSNHFKEVIELIEPILLNSDSLAILNEKLINVICNYLSIKTAIIKSSELPIIDGYSTERLINICKELEATTYLAGFGSTKYQENNKLEEAKIKCVIYDFIHPTYTQLWGEFIPNLSIIDLLFNCGQKSKDVFNGSRG